MMVGCQFPEISLFRVTCNRPETFEGAVLADMAAGRQSQRQRLKEEISISRGFPIFDPKGGEYNTPTPHHHIMRAGKGQSQPYIFGHTHTHTYTGLVFQDSPTLVLG